MNMHLLRIAGLALVLIASMVAKEAKDAEDPLAELTRERPAAEAIARGLTALRAMTTAKGTLNSPTPYGATALALKAHLAGGVTFSGEHAAWMRAAVTQVLAAQDRSGSWAGCDAGRMYTHGIIVLTLAECLGELGDPALEQRVSPAVARGIAVIVASASVAKPAPHAGGWRYSARDLNSDLSVSAWQMQALLAARHAGIAVDEATVERAIAYARGVVSSDGRVTYEGRGEEAPSLRGSALVMLSATTGHAAVREAILARMQAAPIEWKGEWLFYRAYTDALAGRFVAEAAWRPYARRIEALLCSRQAADGTWPVPPGNNEERHGVAYRTAMAVLALSAERQALPSFQR